MPVRVSIAMLSPHPSGDAASMPLTFASIWLTSEVESCTFAGRLALPVETSAPSMTVTCCASLLPWK